jgi:hypothetical protein
MEETETCRDLHAPGDLQGLEGHIAICMSYGKWFDQNALADPKTTNGPNWSTVRPWQLDAAPSVALQHWGQRCVTLLSIKHSNSRYFVIHQPILYKTLSPSYHAVTSDQVLFAWQCVTAAGSGLEADEKKLLGPQSQHHIADLRLVTARER